MITAHEALTRFDEEDAAALKAGEAHIDKALSKCTGPVTIDMPGYSRRVLDRLVQMYDANGWTVTTVPNDQHPGTLLHFVARHTTRDPDTKAPWA